MPAELSRRALLGVAMGGAGVGALVLSGCEVTLPGSDSPISGPGLGKPNPDDALVDRVRAAVHEVDQLVRRTTARHRGLASDLRGLTQLHAAHLARLGGDAPATTSRPPIPAKPAKARGAVLTAERRLHDQLTGWAQTAESGPLARLLAAMAGGITQELA